MRRTDHGIRLEEGRIVGKAMEGNFDKEKCLKYKIQKEVVKMKQERSGRIKEQSKE